MSETDWRYAVRPGGYPEDRGLRPERRERPSPGSPSAEDEEILVEVRDRFRQVVDWESDFRSLFVEDERFCNGDSDNHWQWPENLFQSRHELSRPALTVNKTRQHCLQIINDAKQNKPQIKISPVSDEATKASADVFEGIVRHIEYVSNATSAYDTATEHQVVGGIGWWRVVHDYPDSDSFDQEIRIERVRDAMSVYLDPDIVNADGSDARFAFVIDDCPLDLFEQKYPEYRDRVPRGGASVIENGWLDEDHVRVAEYFRRSQARDVLHLLRDGSTVREGDIRNADLRAAIREVSQRQRTILVDRIEWFKVVGGEIVERKIWPGRYIPLVRVVGEESVLEGRLERKGHVRALKDPQRIYNYWTSSALETVALQSKTPYVAAAESIENYKKYWDKANTENYSVLPFNARDDAGNPLPAPQRQDPPQMPQAYIAGLQISQNEMMMVSGQYAPTMGQPSPNEISGRAIAERQRQGDNATYHFIDNLAVAIRYTGRILIDLIPKIYDTPRVLRILNVDGSIGKVQLDPSSPQALTELQNPSPGQQVLGQAGVAPTPQQLVQAAVLRIFNPLVGTYEVQADIGPSYATKRDEAYNAFVQVISTAPQLLTYAGDLLFKAADFPMAEELAERMQRMVPPQALGQGPSPNEAAMAQQMQAKDAHIALISERLAVAELKLKAKDEQKDIDAYEAITRRAGTLLNAQKTDTAYASGDELRAVVRQMVADMLATGGMAGVAQAAQADMAQQAQQDAVANAPPPPPGMGVPPGVAAGQMAALSPVRAP